MKNFPTSCGGLNIHPCHIIDSFCNSLHILHLAQMTISEQQMTQTFVRANLSITLSLFNLNSQIILLLKAKSCTLYMDFL